MTLARLGELELDYDIAGTSGPVIVLLHGQGMQHYVYLPHRRLLSQAFRVLTPTLRGHGFSTKQGPYTTRQMANDVLGLCDHLRIGQFIVVGSLRNSQTAIRLAAEHPDRVRGLMTLGGVSHLPEQTQKQMGVSIEVIKKHGLRMLADWISENSLSPQTLANTPMVQGLIQFAILRNEPATYIELIQGFLDDHDVRPLLGQIRCPASVVFGTDERFFGVREQLELARAIPGAELKIIPNAGHDCATDQPGLVSAAILELAAKLE